MFAQNNEDDFYGEYLNLNKEYQGKYLDIGAGSPSLISNTEILYKLGWKGLCVEPNLALKEEWRLTRPNDILVQDIIMDVPSSFKMIDSVVEGSWLYEEYLRNNTHPVRIVNAITLKQLLDKYPEFYDVDLFSLDVELREAKVLATVDFTKFTPKLIIIEKQIRGIDSKPLWEHLLLSYYNSVKEFSGNTFYLRK